MTGIDDASLTRHGIASELMPYVIDYQTFPMICVELHALLG